MSDYFPIARRVAASDLTPSQRHLVLVISMHAFGTTGTCVQTISELASEIGKGTRAMRKDLAVLIARGWVERCGSPGDTSVLRILGGGERDDRGGVNETTGGGERDDTPPYTGTTQPQRVVVSPSLVSPCSVDDLLAATRKRHPSYRETSGDRQALSLAIEGGATPEQLLHVWDHHNTEGVAPTQIARTNGWSTRWRSLANKNLGDRLVEAEAWVEAGRPTSSGIPDWLQEKRT